MPYTVTTTTPEPLAPFDRPRAMIETARTTVDTLDEAREAAVSVVREARHWPRASHQPSEWDQRTAARNLPEHGGTIGPLPDGTVIEVRPA